jgi:hypothetical protein
VATGEGSTEWRRHGKPRRIQRPVLRLRQQFGARSQAELYRRAVLAFG